MYCFATVQDYGISVEIEYGMLQWTEVELRLTQMNRAFFNR